MQRKIEILNNSKLVKFKKSDVSLWVRTLDKYLPEDLKAPKGWLSIAVFDDADLSKLHQDFLNDPSQTDVITFDGEPPEFGGEICVSSERALKFAKNYSNTANQELCLYIAHGYLHLAGVNDIEDEDAKKMRAAEKLALDILKEKIKKDIFLFKA